MDVVQAITDAPVEAPVTPAELAAPAPAPVAVRECDTLVLAVDPGLRNIGLYAAAAKLNEVPLPEETPLDVALIDGETEDGIAFAVCARARNILAAVRPQNALVLYETQTVAAGGARHGGHNLDRCGRIVAALLLACELSGVPADRIHSRGIRLMAPKGLTRPQLKKLRRAVVGEKRPAVWDMIVRAQPRAEDQDHLCDAVCMLMQDFVRRRKEHTTAVRADARASAKKGGSGGVRGRDTARPQPKAKVTIL